ncbi:MAG: c-type cytochrome domain-containing protein [Myxococcota bacterium]
MTRTPRVGWMFRLAAIPALGLAGLVACDDTTFTSGVVGGGSTAGGDGWCGVQSLFDAHCTSCHSPGAGPLGGLDLQTDAYTALLDGQSAYSGRTLVVPGDPGASFLVAKLEGTQGSDGGVMPMSGALPASAIDVVKTWIADGATDVCSGGTDTGLTTPVACNDRNEDCAPGTCGGEGGLMLPGADCRACHSPGHGEAPNFTVAGTAFADLAGTEPLVGATVHVVDADGVGRDLVTNAVGNFYTQQPVTMPFTATITAGGTTLSMSQSPSDGSCNSCHQCDGAAGGKLYGP